MSEEQRIWTLLAKKLAGEATAAEQSDLEGLLRDQPSWQYTYEMLAAYWPAGGDAPPHKEVMDRRLDSLRGHIGTKNSVLPANEKTEEVVIPPWEEAGGKKGAWKKWLIAAAVVALLVTGALLTFHTSVPLPKSANEYAGSGKSEVTTRYGSKTKVTLPDGTVVWINSGSKLVYNNRDFGVVNREVTLVGEGFFDVAHDALHPFIIHAGKINVTVLGTAFDIKSYPGDKTIETTLIRGSIEVSFTDQPEKTVLLKPHEKLTVFNDERMITQSLGTVKQDSSKGYKISPMTFIPSDSTVVETSWVQNKLAFRGETFADLAVQMERWYNVNIDFSSSKIKHYRFTGIFVNESLDQALKALQITAPFHYRIEKNEVYISKA
jgi:ferric-dicitrate binding protein FerR (iron transport regulator)